MQEVAIGNNYFM